MSVLTVVRHGQASFLADNYDKLSPLGERQARLLGEYWLEQGVRFDRVIYGPCERQIRTGEIIGGVFCAAGAKWPCPEVRPEFDEYPAEPVMRTGIPALMERHPHVREMVDSFYAAVETEAKRRAFDRLLREVSGRWRAGEVVCGEAVTWEDFCRRVEEAVFRIRSENGRGARVALFTSAGPLAATARVALGLSPEATMELMWTPRNAGISEFFFTAGRFSMSAFNATPHLGSAELTYR
jgi:broad specificity phosphatase PhoE